MSEDKKVLFVEWCAQDALGGTLQMEPMTELAYRRIMDMIYASDDNLIDDDTVLKNSTKTGSKWKTIKRQLIDIHKKLYVENGFIKNRKCSEKLEKAWVNIGQKSDAGRVSAEKRKNALKTKYQGLSEKNREENHAKIDVNDPDKNPVDEIDKPLKNNNLTPTAVTTAVPTIEPTNQEPNNQYKKVSKNPLTPKGENSGFESFWEAYPKQRAGSKDKARQAYEKAINEKRATAEEIENGVSAYRVSDEVSRGFAKGAAAWLNDDRWKNDYAASKPQRQGGQRDQPQASYLDKVQAAGNKALERINHRMEAERDAPWNQGDPVRPAAGQSPLALGNHAAMAGHHRAGDDGSTDRIDFPDDAG